MRHRGRSSRRDPVKDLARNMVARAIRRGALPHPNDMPCQDCGHIQFPNGTRAERTRHEYDHVAGYSSEHHLNVEPVCTLCHAEREMERRRG